MPLFDLKNENLAESCVAMQKPTFKMSAKNSENKPDLNNKEEWSCVNVPRLRKDSPQ